MNYETKIIAITTLAPNISLFRVEKPTGFSFVAGHSIMTSIKKPTLSEKIIPLTPISLSSDNYIDFIVKNYPGKLTEQFFSLKERDSLLFGSMFGSTRYNGEGIFLASGIGIAPFIAMLRQLDKDGKKEDNILFYSVKNKEEILFENELRKTLGDKLIITLTQQKDTDYEHGRISAAMLTKYNADLRKSNYVCGGQLFITDMKEMISNYKTQDI